MEKGKKSKGTLRKFSTLAESVERESNRVTKSMASISMWPMFKSLLHPLALV